MYNYFTEKRTKIATEMRLFDRLFPIPLHPK